VAFFISDFQRKKTLMLEKGLALTKFSAADFFALLLFSGAGDFFYLYLF
jgi:hypothetical protein